MRDPERIHAITQVLFLLWNKPENQDLRLGQLLYNLHIKNRRLTKSKADIFDTEDDEWLEWITNMFAEQQALAKLDLSQEEIKNIFK